jgi:hypothetical protein
MIAAKDLRYLLETELPDPGPVLAGGRLMVVPPRASARIPARCG